jgi:ketosteroid isomerase-like protein
MDSAPLKEVVTAYIEAYNRFDVGGMLAPLHDGVVFKNISNGEVNLTTTGKEEFRRQAEQASQYFSHREQRITSWKVADNQVETAIEYRAVAAVDFPNGLKAGDMLRLQGKSVFRFLDGKIIYIEDIS